MSFKEGREIAEFVEGIVESENSELCGVIFSNECSWRERRAEEVLAIAALLGEGDQEDGQ